MLKRNKNSSRQTIEFYLTRSEGPGKGPCVGPAGFVCEELGEDPGLEDVIGQVEQQAGDGQTTGV